MLDFDQILSFYPAELQPFRTHVLREFLQYKILELLFRSRHGAMLRFMGGTCIHLIHGSPRFSEDLDFDNAGLSKEGFEELVAGIQKELQLEGYALEVKTTLRAAFRASFRFPAILHQSGLTGHRQQKLVVQVDAEPQRFDYMPETALLSKFDVFTKIRTVPVDVLLSQKLLCLFARSRLMGRDVFDTVYLKSKTVPNMNYLQQRLGIKGPAELRARLLSRCDELDFDDLARDVAPFLTKSRDIERVRLFKEYVSSAF